ncbi:chromophore lyase CpcT/CpeT [Algoriphagus sp. A40]|uniref:chromophore lyase CpcT/CpeT n=1 Tax=Algoriphagus sp. A40 TaxID=1945863 RepID=UPI0009C7EE62|nr:chromophore lyase CpcT/CpeT [Algoriphagus sp. A40]OOG73751.1 hypothetical protein B0E43_12950 [Algoriphagus sp. A40]
MKNFILFGFFLLLFSQSGKLKAQTQPQLLEEFNKRIIGEFSTARMASEDPSLAHLILTVKPIWQDRIDGHWFFLEQAEHFRKDLPHRSLVLNVFEKDGKIISRNFSFFNKDIFLDIDERPFPIEQLSPVALESRYCDIIFEKDSSGNFVGKTPEEGCPTNLFGAQFFTNESYLTSDFLISWDRGWKDQDEQAWGLEKFGYLFEKINQ